MNADCSVAEQAERYAHARTESLARYLPFKIWLNPTWAAVGITPFIGLFPYFGEVPVWRLVVALSLHLGNSLLAALTLQRYRKSPHRVRLWETVFVSEQFLIGLSWGAMTWLLWVPDNAVNHALILVPLVAVLISNASSANSWSLYVAGVLPLMGLSLPRMLSGGVPANVGLAVLLTTAFIYTLVVVLNAMHQSRVLLSSRFANEDLTDERRRAHDAALKKQAEAEAANAAKSSFLANMSHELRTPLNAIIGFSDLIEQEAFGPVGQSRYRDYAGDIQSAGRHLLGIIDDILDVAKIEAGQMSVAPEFLDAPGVIEHGLRVLRPKLQAKKQILTIKFEGERDQLYADERAFRQIVYNLISNATKFTQIGGEITVTGRGLEDGGFELCVADNGPGFDPALLERVFEAFNQLDKRYSRQQGGTGLGLSLVRGLTALHGGRVWIETAPGNGCKVSVRFPASSEAVLREQRSRRIA